MTLKHTLAASIILLSLAFCVNAAAPIEGGKLIRHDVEEGWRSRWVGPIGVYCGVWKPDETYLNQLLVQSIDKGSPADGILKVGDMIIGADGTGAEKVPLFEDADWALIPIADAINDAEARDPALLSLRIWHRTPKQAATVVKPPSLDDLGGLDDTGGSLDDWGPSPKKKAAVANRTGEGGNSKGQTMIVSIKLEFLGRYSITASYNCEKSKNILRKGIKAMMAANNPGSAGFQLLCLLAADDPTNPDSYLGSRGSAAAK